MIGVRYVVVEERYLLDEEVRTSYGIAALANAEDEGSATVVEHISDVTKDRERLTEFVDDCNRLQLSTVHFGDVVEDFLAK